MGGVKFEYRYRLNALECAGCGHLVELARSTASDPEKLVSIREHFEHHHECLTNPGATREPLQRKHETVRVLRFDASTYDFGAAVRAAMVQ